MASETEIFESLKELIRETLGTTAEVIDMENSFVDDLDADSLDIVELIMAIESHYDIEINDEDAEGISRVKDAVNFIVSQLA